MNKPKNFLLSAVLSLPLGYLWVCCFLLGFSDNRYAGTPLDRIAAWYPLLFAVCFFLWGSFLFSSRRAQTREHLFWLLCTALIAAAMALGRCRATPGWCYLALHGFAGYWLLCRAGMLTEKITSAFLPCDLLETFVILPFGNFFLRIITFFHALRELLRKAEAASRKNFAAAAVVVVLAVPVFLAAGSLLGQADDTFAAIWNSIGAFFTFRWEIPRWLRAFGSRFVLGLPVGAYLFGLAGGSFRRESPRLNGENTRQSLQKLRLAPTGAVLGVLGCFIALYLVFFGVQAGHLLGAFIGSVPGKLTAAQYARQGFFQLTLVMAINFLLLGAAALCSREAPARHRVLRGMGTVLMVESIFLAVTAAAKLGLYISRFGFTPLRLLSMWGVLVMTAGCVLTIGSLQGLRGAARKWVWFAAATFTALCFF